MTRVALDVCDRCGTTVRIENWDKHIEWHRNLTDIVHKLSERSHDISWHDRHSDVTPYHCSERIYISNEWFGCGFDSSHSGYHVASNKDITIHWLVNPTIAGENNVKR